MQTIMRWDGKKFRVGETVVFGKGEARILKFSSLVGFLPTIVTLKSYSTEKTFKVFLDSLQKLNGCFYA